MAPHDLLLGPLIGAVHELESSEPVPPKPIGPSISWLSTCYIISEVGKSHASQQRRTIIRSQLAT